VASKVRPVRRVFRARAARLVHLACLVRTVLRASVARRAGKAAMGSRESLVHAASPAQKVRPVLLGQLVHQDCESVVHRARPASLGWRASQAKMGQKVTRAGRVTVVQTGSTVSRGFLAQMETLARMGVMANEVRKASPVCLARSVSMARRGLQAHVASRGGQGQQVEQGKLDRRARRAREERGASLLWVKLGREANQVPTVRLANQGTRAALVKLVRTVHQAMQALQASQAQWAMPASPGQRAKGAGRAGVVRPGVLVYLARKAILGRGAKRASVGSREEMAVQDWRVRMAAKASLVHAASPVGPASWVRRARPVQRASPASRANVNPARSCLI